MKLYSVTYSAWNYAFSELEGHSVMAVGSDMEDAIRRTREMVGEDARDFQAMEITDVMGFKILPLDENALQTRLDHTGARMDIPAEQPPGTISLTLIAAGKRYDLSLPASDEWLEQAKEALDVEDFAEAVIDDVKFSAPYLGSLIPLDAVTMEDANDLAHCLQEMEQEDGELLKFCAALEVEQPSAFTEAVSIAMDRDDYERVPEDMDEYGKQALRRIGADNEIINTIDGYMDFAQLGRDTMAEDGVRRTEFGLVRRLSTPFPSQREQGMQMQ